VSRILYNIWAHLHIILYFVKIFPPCTMMNFWVILPNNIQFYLINNNIIFIFIIIGQHQGEFDASQIWSGQPECEPWRTHTTEMWSFFSIFELYQREWNRFKIYFTIPKFLHVIDPYQIMSLVFKSETEMWSDFSILKFYQWKEHRDVIHIF